VEARVTTGRIFLPVAGQENYIRGNFDERFKARRRQRCALILGKCRHEFGMVHNVSTDGKRFVALNQDPRQAGSPCGARGQLACAP
jgi:hypothetical protein